MYTYPHDLPHLVRLVSSASLFTVFACCFSAPGFTQTTLPPTTTGPGLCTGQVPALTEEETQLRIPLNNFEARGVNPGGSNGALNSCHFAVSNLMSNGEPDPGTENSVGFGETSSSDVLSRGSVDAPGHDEPGIYRLADPNHNENIILIERSAEIFNSIALTFRVNNEKESSIENLRLNFRVYDHDPIESIDTAPFTVSYRVGDSPEGPYTNVDNLELTPGETVGEGDLIGHCASTRFNPSLESDQTLFIRLEVPYQDVPAVTPSPNFLEEIGFSSFEITENLADTDCPSMPTSSAIKTLPTITLGIAAILAAILLSS